VDILPIELVRGDSWSGFKVRWRDTNGDPVPLASALMQVRLSPDADEVLLELTDGDGLTIDSDQYVTPAITPAQSANLRSGHYDLQVTSTSGGVLTLIGGPVKVTPDVSR
jgi:hypothetical protein